MAGPSVALRGEACRLTDMLGGWLFGLGWLLALLAFVGRVHLRIM